MQVLTEQDLRERCFGQFEGHTWTEIETQWPEASQAWRQRVPDWAPPDFTPRPGSTTAFIQRLSWAQTQDAVDFIRAAS